MQDSGFACDAALAAGVEVPVYPSLRRSPREFKPMH